VSFFLLVFLLVFGFFALGLRVFFDGGFGGVRGFCGERDRGCRKQWQSWGLHDWVVVGGCRECPVRTIGTSVAVDRDDAVVIGAGGREVLQADRNFGRRAGSPGFAVDARPVRRVGPEIELV